MKDKIEEKFKELTEEDLKKINGGFASAQYQLYYQNQPLNMEAKIKDLCVTYPELKEALGTNYIMVANSTLNAICQLFGEEMVQNLIDNYNGQTA